MKKLITNVLILGLFLTTIFIIGTNTSWACKSAYMQTTTSDEDPNDSDSEYVPEITLADINIIYLETDPNEPNEPNEPDPDDSE